jgi:type III secretory pathway component EscS
MTNKRQFSLRHTVATCGASLFVLGAVVAGGGAGFFNVPSLLITLGLPFFLLFGIHGSTFLGFLVDGALTLFSEPPKRDLNKTYQQIILQFCRFTFGAGVLGTLIAFIQMLRNLEDPSSIGMGFSVALLTVLYALLASEVYLAFLYFAYAEKPETPQPISSKGTTLAAGVIALALILFFAMMLIFCPSDNLQSSSSGSIDVPVELPESPGQFQLDTWFATDAPEAFEILKENVHTLGNAASLFLQSVPADQRNSPATKKKLEVELINAASSLLRSQGLSNTVHDAFVCHDVVP